MTGLQGTTEAGLGLLVRVRAVRAMGGMDRCLLPVGDGTVLFRLTAGMRVRKQEQLESLPDSALTHKGEDEQQHETTNGRGPLQYKSPSLPVL